tara:strand:- start:181 stop:447 length:267 start_codon:yes stop_codon:yes gene_type:complete
MPPYIPFHLACVYISGIIEIVGGIGFLFKKSRKKATLLLILLLIAVFPANIHMTLHADQFIDYATKFTLIYIRLPLQFMGIALLWYSK